MAVAIVGGALANKPFNGGEAWVRLSWVLGLRRLGFDVCLVEQLAREACVDEAGAPAPFAASANRAFFEAVVAEFGLAGRAGLLCDAGEEGVGLGLGELREAAAEAAVLFDLSGHLGGSELLRGPRVRVYVDLDPGFTQAWHADEGLAFRLGDHDRYVTVGFNVGGPGWPLPAGGIEWIPTLPPVLLEEWAPRPPLPGPLRFTTVARWRNRYGPIEICGRSLGLKHHALRRLIELPERVEGASFEIALEIEESDAADREALLDAGWRLLDPRQVAATPDAYRDYVLGSGAEFSVAQGVYAETSSGWFSDRTAAYLAGGRPALVQDTGFGKALPHGEGLLAFSSLDQAVAGAERIIADPEAHGRAARRLAEERLDSDLVLGRLLAAIGLGDAVAGGRDG
jgi:hypothetical protein